MRPDAITDPQELKVTVPLRISYRQRNVLRDLAEDKGLSVNQLLLDTLERGGLVLS